MHKYRFDLYDAISYANESIRKAMAMTAYNQNLSKFNEIEHDSLEGYLEYTDGYVCCILLKEVAIHNKIYLTKFTTYHLHIGNWVFEVFCGVNKYIGAITERGCSKNPEEVYSPSLELIYKYFSKCGIDVKKYNILAKPVSIGNMVLVICNYNVLIQCVVPKNYFSGNIFEISGLRDIFNQVVESKSKFIHKMFLLEIIFPKELLLIMLKIAFHSEFGPNCKIL